MSEKLTLAAGGTFTRSTVGSYGQPPDGASFIAPHMAGRRVLLTAAEWERAQRTVSDFPSHPIRVTPPRDALITHAHSRRREISQELIEIAALICPLSDEEKRTLMRAEDGTLDADALARVVEILNRRL